jgi:hypothetical protein
MNVFSPIGVPCCIGVGMRLGKPCPTQIRGGTPMNVFSPIGVPSRIGVGMRLG